MFEILQSSSALCEKVANNTNRFRSKMTEAGFKISGNDHAISPVMIGDAKLANILANKMLSKNYFLFIWYKYGNTMCILLKWFLDEGIYVIGFSYPVVPQGAARVRVQISAAHDYEQIDTAVNAFTKIGKELKIIWFRNH